MALTPFFKAIQMALADAMAADDSVILFGEDVAAAGGPFGVTRGLLDRFGPDRVRDTPIAEATLANLAVGAAQCGLKPVVEIMFMDFLTLAMDGIANQAAKTHFMYGGQFAVPLVVRTQHGGGLSAGPHHSQCLEAWLAHVPGLKVVVPATPADAYGLLRAAIDDPDPVIFVEHKGMYGAKGELAEPPAPVAIGEGRIARAGRDVSVVAYGAAVGMALAAATAAEADGLSVEVIDLRSVAPWDDRLVLESLARTHRLVIAHEAAVPFGIGAEIAAWAADVGFDELDAPILRVGSEATPIPFAKSLEQAHRIDAERVLAACRRVVS